MGFPTFPPFNFVHVGTMYQNKMFSKDRKNGHMIFNYCPLTKDYADTIFQKQDVKNGFPGFPAFPPFSFVHAGTTFQNIKFNKDEKNGYMVFDYCPLTKDYADTIFQKQDVKNGFSGFPTFPPFNFVHAGTMYQNKMFSKDRKNGHMLFDYCPLTKDYADTIFQKQDVKNGFPGFPAFPPFSFVHAGTTFQNIKFNKDEKNGYMVFDYCPLTKDYADTIFQKQDVKNGFSGFPACPPFSFVHARTTYQNIKFNKNENNGYMIFDYCPLKKDLANTIVQETAVENEEPKKSNNGLLVEQSNLRENDVLTTGIQPKRRTIWCRIKKSLRRMICCA